jgi:hypothetical protein
MELPRGNLMPCANTLKLLRNFRKQTITITSEVRKTCNEWRGVNKKHINYEFGMA